MYGKSLASQKSSKSWQVELVFADDGPGKHFGKYRGLLFLLF
jgi:hypothetical protein